MKIPIEVSARHAHLCQNDIDALFGKDYKLKKMRQLSQPFEFAAEETVSLKSHTDTLEHVRVIGPAREKTQVEISRTDAIFLGVDAHVRLSGDIVGSPGIILIGPAGQVEIVEIKEGLIIAERHIHCSKEEAKKLNLKDRVSVEIDTERPIIFKNIKVRVSENYKLCMHIDTDEGNACGINKLGAGQIL